MAKHWDSFLSHCRPWAFFLLQTAFVVVYVANSAVVVTVLPADLMWDLVQMQESPP